MATTLVNINDLIKHNEAVPDLPCSIPELNACIVNNGDGTGSLQVRGGGAGGGDATAANQITQINLETQIAGNVDSMATILNDNIALATSQGAQSGSMAVYDKAAVTLINNNVVLANSQGAGLGTFATYDRINGNVFNTISTNTRPLKITAVLINISYTFTQGSNQCIMFAIDNTTGARYTGYTTTNTTALEKCFALMSISEILNFAQSNNYTSSSIIATVGRNVTTGNLNPITLFILTT